MLKLEQVKLKDGMVLINMELPQISDTINGIHKSEETKELEFRQTEHRLGVVIAEGKLNKELLTSILQGSPDTAIGKTILFSAMAVDPFKIPIEGYEKDPLILIRFDYLLGEIVEEV